MKTSIKFRGKRIDNGEFIYGDLLTGDGEFTIDSGSLLAMVEPDSVSQLVGFDKDGNEIYADDLDVEKTARKMVDDLAAFAKENQLTAIAAVGDECFFNGNLVQVFAEIANLINRIAEEFDRLPVPAAASIAITLAAHKVGEHESDIGTVQAAIKLVREAIDATELTVEGSANEEVSRN